MPAIDITSKRRFKANEFPVTIVLKHEHNARNGNRLVHTYWHEELRRGVFVANDDDRPEHSPRDRGITWLSGHVPFDSPEAKELLKQHEKSEE